MASRVAFNRGFASISAIGLNGRLGINEIANATNGAAHINALCGLNGSSIGMPAQIQLHQSQHSQQQQQQQRWKHSKRQINRLFRKNPARLRVARRMDLLPKPEPIPERRYPAIMEANILTNGWSAPPGPDVEVPAYPFLVARTKNKPNNAAGFLPVYSEFRKDGSRVTTRIRKVTGDTEDFLTELRAVLQLNKFKNPRDDPIRVRVGGTVEIKGNRVREVKQWLAELGF
eukprot:CAMPEP_0198108234 /NCGR_PEP_ID=MMETSP1442-20131203/297_1 /TAXON_ID= /ORGANISM="Craspedostauros australis, Strain CCMP3328" /LENGTH=229 /DNA_ID=CAMNT_0043763463 /DNA_START=71 /DNA_END=760 /DNA_ORIENTATION=+